MQTPCCLNCSRSQWNSKAITETALDWIRVALPSLQPTVIFSSQRKKTLECLVFEIWLRMLVMMIIIIIIIQLMMIVIIQLLLL